jgi:hypothetical protein
MELLLSYLHLIKTEGEVTQPELLKKSNASAAQLKGLSDKNILLIEKRATDRYAHFPGISRSILHYQRRRKPLAGSETGTYRKAGLFIAWCNRQRQNRSLYKTDRRIYTAGQTGFIYVARDRAHLTDHPAVAKTFWRLYSYLSFQIQSQ